MDVLVVGSGAREHALVSRPDGRPRRHVRCRGPRQRRDPGGPAPTRRADLAAGGRRPRGGRCAPISSSSVPRRRWSPGSRTPSVGAASPASGLRHAAAADRGQQGVRQGGDGRRGRADRAGARCAPPQARWTPALDALRPAVRRQGRRAGRRAREWSSPTTEAAARAHAAACLARPGGRVVVEELPRRPRGVAVLRLATA